MISTGSPCIGEKKTIRRAQAHRQGRRRASSIPRSLRPSATSSLGPTCCFSSGARTCSRVRPRDRARRQGRRRRQAGVGQLGGQAARHQLGHGGHLARHAGAHRGRQGARLRARRRHRRGRRAAQRARADERHRRRRRGRHRSTCPRELVHGWDGSAIVVRGSGRQIESDGGAAAVAGRARRGGAGSRGQGDGELPCRAPRPQRPTRKSAVKVAAKSDTARRSAASSSRCATRSSMRQACPRTTTRSRPPATCSRDGSA